ncbi:MAG: DUF456 domain-containing protein [Pseudomonadales bacterium]
MDILPYIDVLWWTLSLLLVVGGVAGLLLPAIPGPLLIFAGLWLAAWIEDYAEVGWGALTFIGLLALASYVADFVAGALGTKHFGASARAVWGAVLGAIVGIFLGLPGILLGPFVGAVIGELSGRRSLQEAGLAGLGATLGLAVGVALKVALAVAMIGMFAVLRLF